MQILSNNPSLYGISSANSSRAGSDLWGKNQFNTTFPLSLCLYMRDKSINPVSIICAKGKIVTNEQQWNMQEVIGPENTYYCFEKSFDNFSGFYRDSTQIDKIDIVATRNHEDVQPLEIKLTVLPDISTASQPDDLWGPEIVVRPVSSAHAMMSLAYQLRKEEHKSLRHDIISALKTGYNKINDWNNISEILKKSDALLKSLREALKHAESIQLPFLIQPIWKTIGQSLVLSKQCFDVFVWSDVSVMMIPLGIPKSQIGQNKDKVPRMLREIARHVRALYDILVTGDYNYGSIYKGMPLGSQTDKSFSVPGRVTRNYMTHQRLHSPCFSREVLGKLILNSGQLELKPERRFDAAVLVHMTTQRDQ